MKRHIVKKFREKLENLSISDYQGLKSPGLTCYLNSVLQVLFMTEEFREAVTRKSSEIPETIDRHLRELFLTLEGNVAKTDNITKRLGIKDVYEQRDAAEYFEKILCRTSPEASKIFKGELNHKTTCLKCKQTNSSQNFFWVLPLSMGDSKSRSYSVLEGWKSFFKVQRVSEDNQMFCSGCNQKQDADIEYEMTHCPDVLTLLLKRFSFDYQRNCYVKLQCKADVPQTLETKDCRYDLYAVVHHFGDLMGGHYTADIRSFETGNWYCFNDNTVKSVNKLYVNSEKNRIRSTTAYLLMYRLVSGRLKRSDGSVLEAYWTPSGETGDGFNETEPEKDFVSENLLKTESCRAEDIQHLSGDMSRDDVVRRKHSKSFRGGNEDLKQRSPPTVLQERMRIPINTDIKDAGEQMCHNNTEKPSDWTFHQSSVSPVKGVGVNWDKRAYSNASIVYNYDSLRERITSAGTRDVFNYREAPSVVATQSNGLTATKRTFSNDVANYIANPPNVYTSSSSLTRSSRSFRTAAEPSSLSPLQTTKSFMGNDGFGATGSSLRSKNPEREKASSPRK